MLERKIKHIPVASMSQNKGNFSKRFLMTSGKCLKENNKLNQVIVPSTIPSIILIPLFKNKKGTHKCTFCSVYVFLFIRY